MSGRTDKYARMSEQLNKAKQQRIKDVQDQWKSQFIDPKEAKQLPTLKSASVVHNSVLNEEEGEEP